jgi:hypothetical protein
MRRTAECLADAGEETVTREVIRQRDGLVFRKISSTASSGHYAWIWSRMQTFLVRNQDIIARSTAMELRLTRKVVKAKKACNGRVPMAVSEDFKWPPRSALRLY